MRKEERQEECLQLYDGNRKLQMSNVLNNLCFLPQLKREITEVEDFHLQKAESVEILVLTKFQHLFS